MYSLVVLLDFDSSSMTVNGYCLVTEVEDAESAVIIASRCLSNSSSLVHPFILRPIIRSPRYPNHQQTSHDDGGKGP